MQWSSRGDPVSSAVLAGGANQVKVFSDHRASAMIGEALPTQAFCP
jgi:hypothetical protein